MKKIFFLAMITIIIGAFFISCDQSTGTDTGGAVYKAGTYSITRSGYYDSLNVEVTFSSTKISNVRVVTHKESIDRPAVAKALVDIPLAIVEAQSTGEDVDVVAGASRTSEGIKAAVDIAIVKAQGNEDLSPPYKDGTFTAAGKGYGGYLTLAVTFLANKITEIDIIDNNESAHHIDRVRPVLLPAIVKEQSTEVDATTVDAISSSSRTTEGITDAVDAAIRKSKAAL